MDDSFAAKRRNLLIATSVLIFIKYAEADIEGATSLALLKFQVGKPEAIVQAIWVVWLYFLLRAYQHYKYYLKNEYLRATQKTIVPLMHRYLSGAGVPLERERFFFEDLERFHNYELAFRPVAAAEQAAWILHSSRRSLQRAFSREWRGGINLLRDRGRRRKLIRWHAAWGQAWRITIWTITDRSLGGAGKMPIEVAGEAGLAFRPGLILWLRTKLAIVIGSAPFFEQRLPFIFALIPVIYYWPEWMAVVKSFMV